MIMFLVSLLYHSTTRPILLLKKRRSRPTFNDSISCQLIPAEIGLGVPNWKNCSPLPDSQAFLLMAIVARYKELGTDWSPINPHDPRILAKLSTGSSSCINDSFVITHPPEKEGYHLQRRCDGNFEVASYRRFASNRYLSMKE